MSTLIFLVVGYLASSVVTQQYPGDSRNAKILQESRYLQGSIHGSAYLQDDGTAFKEETDADGTRRGSYTYIDDTGKKISVQYTAGKNGFVVEGDHLPKAPKPVAQVSSIEPIPHQYNVKPQGLQELNQYTKQHHFNQVYDFRRQHQNPIAQYNPSYESIEEGRFNSGKLTLNRSPDGFEYSFQLI